MLNSKKTCYHIDCLSPNETEKNNIYNPMDVALLLLNSYRMCDRWMIPDRQITAITRLYTLIECDERAVVQTMNYGDIVYG